MLKLSRVLASVCLLPVLAQADSLKPEDAVEYRQSAFRLMSFQLSVLNPLHRQRNYSDEQFAYRAETLQRLGQLALEGYTPESAGVSSRSSARVWDEFDDFSERMQAFVEITGRMAEHSAAGDDRETRELFRQTLQSCRSCHDRYRLD